MTCRDAIASDLPLPGTDRPEAASSSVVPNIALGTGSTCFVKGLVRARGGLEAEATADDLFHDFGGAAEVVWTRLSVQARPTAYSCM